MDKKDVRKYIREKKRSLTEEYRIAAEKDVMRQIETLPCFQSSSNILLYYSLPDELPTELMLQKWSKEKRIYLPRVKGDDLEILEYSSDSLSEGAYNIQEPTGEEIVSPHEIDLVIVPAVAYDKKGNRIGRGKGYYDRFLSGITAYKIGICYSFQVIEEIVPDKYDVAVDIVLSNKD